MNSLNNLIDNAFFAFTCLLALGLLLCMLAVPLIFVEWLCGEPLPENLSPWAFVIWVAFVGIVWVQYACQKAAKREAIAALRKKFPTATEESLRLMAEIECQAPR